jgi:mRNA interferase MazF
MVSRIWAPDRGELIWVNLIQQSGREQTGHRPAFVISPALYNRKSGLALMCPVTSKMKGYPFEVLIPNRFPIDGVILADQVRSLDWSARNAEFICKLPDEISHEVLNKLGVVLARDE